MIKKLSPLFILFILILDQLTKLMVLKYAGELPLEITSFFNLILVWNKGISFGLFNNMDSLWITYILSFIVVLVLGYVAILLVREKKASLVLAYSFIIGGAIGNLIDRLIHGRVIDFLDFHINGYHWPAFNIADSFIVIGVAIYCIFHCKNK